MNRLLPFLLVVFFSASVNAQDIITLRDGTEYQVKVVEVTETAVKYKMFSSPDGPVYSVPKGEVFTLRYENGEKGILSDHSDVQIGDAYAMLAEYFKPYRSYRRDYNTRQYVYSASDLYIPVVAGLMSAFTPGLGQFYCGEPNRGLLFYIGDALLLTTAMISVSAENYEYYNFDENSYTYHSGINFIGGMAIVAALAVYVWNVFDAVHVAKVKNMRYNDFFGRQSSLSFNMSPGLSLSAPVPGVDTRLVPMLSVGLSF